MDKIIVANLKMNMIYDDVRKYLEDIKQNIFNNVIFCPSDIFIPYFIHNNHKVGIQNVAPITNNITGEISVKQVSSLGIKYAIVGHSERRIQLNESNKEINKKVLLCLENNIVPILCVGETYESHELGKTKEFIKKQLLECLDGIDNINNIIIAYEPIWAIGTNKTPSKEEIIDVFKTIKDMIETIYNQKELKLLYGGSINHDNAKEFNDIPLLDGYLIGTSALDSYELKKIIEVTLV
jgi:triosephosphate isomerase